MLCIQDGGWLTQMKAVCAVRSTSYQSERGPRSGWLHTLHLIKERQYMYQHLHLLRGFLTFLSQSV